MPWPRATDLTTRRNSAARRRRAGCRHDAQADLELAGRIRRSRWWRRCPARGSPRRSRRGSGRRRRDRDQVGLVAALPHIRAGLQRRLRMAGPVAGAVDEIELVLHRRHRMQPRGTVAVEHAFQHPARIGAGAAPVGLEEGEQHLRPRPLAPGDRRQRAGNGHCRAVGRAVADADAQGIASRRSRRSDARHRASRCPG